MQRKFLTLLLLLAVAHTAFAEKFDVMEDLTIGASFGYHPSRLRFPELPKDAYSNKPSRHSVVASIFAEYGITKNLYIRPELAFLGRGGKLNLDMKKMGGVNGLYSLKSAYFDIRIPVLYKFPLEKTKFEPYAYIAPIIGFSAGGRMRLQEMENGVVINDYNIKLSKGNMASTLFAMGFGGGVTYPITIANNICRLGVEVGYELGLTDTRSKREKSGSSVTVNHVDNPVVTPRRLSGWEMKVVFSVPLSIFKQVKKSKASTRHYVATTPSPVEKSCYTLEEIKQLISEGKEVKGKTICAVDDINFDVAKSIIKPEAASYLNKVAEVLIETGLLVEVKGHTDNTGSPESNMELSKNRALAVVDYLKSQGVSPKNISYSYYGETAPLTTNNTTEGQKLNRRVEFVLNH
jgi:OOP family OmpA-OmpF porin